MAGLQFVLASVVFLTAGGALVLEIVAGRLIAPYLGMSLYTWTAIIAVVLAGLSAGHWIGGRLATPNLGFVRGGRRMGAALAAAAVSALAILPLLRVVAQVVQSAGLEAVSSAVLLSSLLFFMPSLFVGIVSPVATKLALDDRPGEAGGVLGRMFAAGALGSIVGTLSAGYLFISWVGTTGTVIVVAAMYALLAAGFTFAVKRSTALLALLVAGLAATAGWGYRAGAYTTPCTVESDYFCIRIDDFSDASGRESRLMVLDHLVHSINDRTDPELLYSPYVHFVDEIARMRFGPDDGFAAFFVGGGGLTLPRAWRSAFPGSSIFVAEIDPAVTRAALDYLWLGESIDGMTVVHADARTVLRDQSPESRFDVIFGDAFHDVAVPAHLVTDEFNRLVAERLRPDGFYALNAVDRAENPRFVYALVRTLKQRFAAVEVWVAGDVSRDDQRVTFIVLAASAETPFDRLIAAEGVERTWLKWPPDKLTARVAYADVPVLTDSFAPVERLLRAP